MYGWVLVSRGENQNCFRSEAGSSFFLLFPLLKVVSLTLTAGFTLLWWKCAFSKPLNCCCISVSTSIPYGPTLKSVTGTVRGRESLPQVTGRMRSELAEGRRVSPDEGRGIGAWTDKISQFTLFGLCWVVLLQVLQHLMRLNRTWKSERGHEGWADEESRVAYDLFFAGGSPPDLWITGVFFLQQILLPCYPSARSLHLTYTQSRVLSLFFQPCCVSQVG